MKILIPIFLFALIISCSEQQKGADCKKLKTGNFRYHPRDPQKAIDYKISRNDSVQTEINLGRGDTTYYKINWPEDCTYVLEKIDHNIDSSKFWEIIKRAPINVEILSTSENYYIYRSSSKINPMVITDTMWIEK